MFSEPSAEFSFDTMLRYGFAAERLKQERDKVGRFGGDWSEALLSGMIASTLQADDAWEYFRHP